MKIISLLATVCVVLVFYAGGCFADGAQAWALIIGGCAASLLGVLFAAAMDMKD